METLLMTDIPEHPPYFECRSFRESKADATYLATKSGRKPKDKKPLKFTDSAIEHVDPPHGWQSDYDNYERLYGLGPPRGAGDVSIWFHPDAEPVEADLVTWMKHLLSAPAHHLNSQEIQMMQKVLRAMDKDADTIDSAQTFDIDEVRVVETTGRSTGPAESPQEVWRWQYIDRVLDVPGRGMYLQRNAYVGESGAFLKHQPEVDACFRSIRWAWDYR
jgi:hypothetical protein